MEANLENFEFAALQQADNYRVALLAEFAPHLCGHILEVGSGIGQLTEALQKMPEIERLVSVEPNGHFAARLRSRLPRLEMVQGTIDDVPADWMFDAILSVNVLEHIDADEHELGSYHRHLSERHGALCLFVPARPEIFAPIDRDFGHFRRYTRSELGKKLAAAGFAVQRLTYFNLLGYLGWWWNFCLLKKRRFAAAQVRFFDRLVFPLQHRFEAHVLRPPIGMSLLAVAAAANPAAGKRSSR